MVMMAYLPACAANTRQQSHDHPAPEFSMLVVSPWLVFLLFAVRCQGVRSQIEDVRAGMLENVDKVLERGEKIEVK